MQSFDLLQFYVQCDAKFQQDQYFLLAGSRTIKSTFLLKSLHYDQPWIHVLSSRIISISA